jgi:hypothetical protein
MSSAVAGKLVTGDQIAKNTITSQNLAANSVGRSELQNGLAKDGEQGPAGETGPQGAPGPSGQEGAFYAVANYDVGNTNSGANATVACSATSQDFTAIAGGVQSLGLGGHPAAVASSFPGRMDWANNEPFEGRLDGWIAQFDAADNPLTVKVWALCVPRTNIGTVETYKQSLDVG